MKVRGPTFRPCLPLSGILGFRQHDQSARQFVGAECVGSGRNDQLAKLLHLAVSEVSRLVFERLQFRVEVPWLAHHVLHMLSMQR
ncbi:hypothetical protein A1351_13940 [Methylosinus sp. R-45379]|nr:hypothetical protein A1351_13940 [Methylosinus sp. R-45379]